MCFSLTECTCVCNCDSEEIIIFLTSGLFIYESIPLEVEVL